MATCQNCSAQLSQGRNYCAPHYRAAIQKYNVDLLNYENEIKKWENLTVVERQVRDKNAEDDNLKFGAGLLGVILPYALFWLLSKVGININFLVEILATLACVFLFLKSPIRLIAGKLFRVLFYAAIPSIAVSWLIVFLLSDFNFDKSTTNYIFIIGCISGVVYSMYRELKGKNHASGKPQKPIKPNP